MRLLAGEDTLTARLTRRSGPLAQPKPDDCDQLWGYSYFLSDTGEVEMLCLPKMTENWRGNGKFESTEGTAAHILSEATRNTLKCTNRDGHGFFLSRKEQRVF